MLVAKLQLENSDSHKLERWKLERRDILVELCVSAIATIVATVGVVPPR
jgi:hypothetical protein